MSRPRHPSVRTGTWGAAVDVGDYLTSRKSLPGQVSLLRDDSSSSRIALSPAAVARKRRHHHHDMPPAGAEAVARKAQQPAVLTAAPAAAPAAAAAAATPAATGATAGRPTGRRPPPAGVCSLRLRCLFLAASAHSFVLLRAPF